ncbi:cation/H+ antiporter, putative [Plasmodium vivax]|uniref:Calcium antiporter, putative n=6 Tax=Plasmodium vivax TaxID=5855 RepID=A5K1N3_PLAVS|nr:calcium antiporter, putative [Plasmodium vivax]KMZ79419.1 calcium antiporter [Plasmodium vivax India VII]KMZ85805.1 calcium antiporter [Plasmodium vivax Brazil I]KMZ91977.1 calcium antiporter [Plasmodium vivax Mauritania I]KMZ98514.1 calcium antiporter [Plasmodium vivax North Korean]EDL46333.1 calcium antiporter, putative [Plasmodium vivax]|eukprot:XP_001616060.1 calcium antiporter [Plasmodium vivax Sal-1]
MVMGRVRATSYVRRTISQPLNKNVAPIKSSKSTTGLNDTNLIRNKNLHLQLLCNNKTPNGGVDDDLEQNYGYREIGAYYSLKKSDVTGIYNMLKNKLNIFLIFVPIGIISYLIGCKDIYIFFFNFMALIPLSALMGHVTEDLALHTGEIIGGLLNATFGNLMEMIFSIQALNAGLINVVQGTLLGSILSNLLLVLGMSFFAGGLYHHVQKFNEKGATCSTSLLLLSSLAITIPTVSSVTTNNNVEVLLKVSRITAVLIFLTYCLFLLFQLYTHISLFQDKEMTEEVPQLSVLAGSIFLILITVLVSVHSEYLITTIEAVVKYYNISENFIGVILLPVVGNATEHLTAVTVAIKNKVDLTMGVAVGSSAQIALFVVPVTVLFGWILNKPMTLAFSPLSSVILVISVIVTMAIVQDGESNWLEGVLLITAYLIVGVVFWFDTS